MHLRSSGVRGQDCDRCHDAHEATYRKFLREPGGANFCWNCHSRAGPANHPVDLNARAAGVNPADTEWDPAGGDYSGTRLWNLEGTGPGDYIKCLTCHSAHGGEPDTHFNTMVLESRDPSHLYLCLNCHQDKEGG
jgi:predicted CXXCH cytochrome family protein